MRVARSLTLALLLSACSGSTTQTTEPQSAPSPPAYNVPAEDAPPPKPLPGLGDIELSRREAALFDQLITELYAPCPSEAVPLRQCVEESRSCAACVPAARLLAQKVRSGITAEQGRGLYKARFGPELKQVALDDSPAKGPADAKVTIVVFSDFECPFCGRAMPLIEHAFEKFSPRVRLVHKFYPLRQHEWAEGAARAAIAAMAQGKYWEMEKALFEHQRDLRPADLDQYAVELGLDLQRFRADMRSARATQILERDHAEGERAGLNGTPMVIINGREVDFAYFHLETDLEPWIRTELDLAGAPAKAAAAP